MAICVYYDEHNRYIIDTSPWDLDPQVRSRLEEVWNHHISRDILLLVSDGVERLPDIQDVIGHSPSTLHAALDKLVQAGFVKVEMSYKGKKQKVLSTDVVCVTKNPKSRQALQKFFQGLWVDSEKTNKVIAALQEEKGKWWSPEELSAKTRIPVDEIELVLSNFDSPMTRSLSHFLKEPPFEKKALYKAR